MLRAGFMRYAFGVQNQIEPFLVQAFEPLGPEGVEVAQRPLGNRDQQAQRQLFSGHITILSSRSARKALKSPGVSLR